MIRHLTTFLSDRRWKRSLLSAGLTVATARFAFGDPAAAPSLDGVWYMAVTRAESLLAAPRPGVADSVGRAAVAEQVRLGVYVLGSLVRAGISADSLLAGPSAAVRAYEPANRGWSHQLFRMTSVIGAATSLLSLGAALRGASPGAQRILGYVGGAAAGIAGVLHRSSGSPDPRSDSIERIRTVGLESELYDSVQQTERTASSLWQDLGGMALDSCGTDAQMVSLSRRYSNALPVASELFSGMARSSALAQSCARHPGYDKQARERFGALATRLDEVGGLWQERRWLFERSRTNALDYLVLIDHP